MPTMEVNPAKDLTRALATEARRLGTSAQMVSSHKRPHNRKIGCIPYYIAATMPQELGGALENGIHRAVRDVCLWLPEAEEFLSHGSPNFRVRGKTFATYVVNHHGGGRVALWLNAAPGAQDSWVGADADRFFVPPYVGSRGWLGVRLDKGLSWTRIAALVRESYEKVAPAALTSTLCKKPAVTGPESVLVESE